MSTCPYCGKDTYQKRNGKVAGKQRFKCRFCEHNYTEGVPIRTVPHKVPGVAYICRQCGKESPNPDFCSLACWSAYQNMHNVPKREKQQRFCKHCGKPTKSRYFVCADCNPNNVDWSRRTVGEIQYAAKYQVSAALRTVARRVFKESQRPRICQNCGYEKHVEICHIQAINSFPPDTPVSVVSGPENLVALCPNCHWEFDHGLLLAVDIPGLKP